MVGTVTQNIDDFNTITPHLVVRDAPRAIEFYTRAFKAAELYRNLAPDGKSVMHAELMLGNSRFLLHDEFPDTNLLSPLAYQGTAVTLHLYVEDVDAVFAAAIEAGENTDGTAYLRAAAAYVDGMYQDAKAALRPIHDALIELGCSMGEDVKICPCSTIVPLYRSHVFAQIKPSTRARIDFGLALKGMNKKIPKRLVDTGGLKKGDRITHRFPITSLADIDAEVREWVKVAYDLDAE
jgi:uncharacterized glyoxalase superfamily protein PhnB